MTQQQTMAVLLERYLRTQTKPCPGCMTALSNLQGDTCPRCHARLRLKIGSGESVRKEWLFGVVCMAIALGLMIAPQLVVILSAFDDPRRAFSWERIANFYESGGGIIQVLTLILGASLYYWASRRQMIGRQSVALQQTLATLCFLTIPGALFLLYHILRG